MAYQADSGMTYLKVLVDKNALPCEGLLEFLESGKGCVKLRRGWSIKYNITDV